MDEKMTPKLFNDLINLVVELRITPAEFFKRIYYTVNNDVIEKINASVGCYMIKDPELIVSLFQLECKSFPNHFMTQFEASLDPYKRVKSFVKSKSSWRTLAYELPRRPNYLHNISKANINILIKYFDKLLTNADIITCDIRNVCLKYTIDAMAFLLNKIPTNCLNGNSKYYKPIVKHIMKLALIRRIKFSCFYFDGYNKSENSMETSPSYIKIKTLDAVRRSGSLIVDGYDMTDLLTTMKETDIEDMVFEFSGSEDVNKNIALMVYNVGIGSPSLNTLPLVLYELAMQPVIQFRLHDEIIETLKKFKGYITQNTVNEMVLLHAVVLETYRKYPYITFMDRRCVKEDGFIVKEPFTKINKEEMIFTSVFALQNDCKNVLGGNEFNPDRYLTYTLLEPIFEELGYRCDINPIAHMPFGNGPLSTLALFNGCIQIKLSLIHILRNFVVLPCEETPKEIKFDPLHVDLTPLGELPLTFKRHIRAYSSDVDEASTSPRRRPSSETQE